MRSNTAFNANANATNILMMVSMIRSLLDWRASLIVREHSQFLVTVVGSELMFVMMSGDGLLTTEQVTTNNNTFTLCIHSKACENKH